MNVIFKVTHVLHKAKAGVSMQNRKVMNTQLLCHLYLATLDITNRLDHAILWKTVKQSLAIASIFQGSVGTRPAGATKV